MKKQLGQEDTGSLNKRVISLLKTNHKDLRAFVQLVEGLVQPDADTAAFLDETGAMLVEQDRIAGAVKLWERAAALYEQQGRLEEEAWLYANMGPVVALSGDILRGIEFSRKAENLAGQLSSEAELLHHISSDLGAMYTETGDWEAAMYEESRALEISQEMHDDAGQIDALLTLVGINIVRGDVSSARSEAMSALTLAHACGNTVLEAQSLGALGDASEIAGQYEQAVREYERGLTLEAGAPDPETCARLHFSLSVVYDAMGNAVEAAEQRNLAEAVHLPLRGEDEGDGDYDN